MRDVKAWVVLGTLVGVLCASLAWGQTPFEQMKDALRQSDPDSDLVLLVKEGEPPDGLIVVVSDAFHREGYQERLQFITSLVRGWENMTGRSQAPVVVVDRGFNPVGGSDGSAVWAAKY